MSQNDCGRRRLQLLCPPPASPTAHQCNWRCRLNLCYPVGRGCEAFLPLGIFPSRQARSDRHLQEVEGGVKVAPRGRDCAAAPVSYCSRPRRAPAGGDAMRKDRGSREKSWLQIGEGHGEGEGSSDSEGLKVNRLRGFERSTPLCGIASTAGSGLDWLDRTVGLGPDRTRLILVRSGPKVKDRTVKQSPFLVRTGLKLL